MRTGTTVGHGIKCLDDCDVSFCSLQMVATNEANPSSSDPGGESGTALSKLRQTLSSSLMTAQDKGKSVCNDGAVDL